MFKLLLWPTWRRLAVLVLACRIITFNTIKTKKGWMWAGGAVVVFGLIQLYYIVSAIMQKRRHMRALDDVKKM